MKIAVIALFVTSTLLMIRTLICGLWIDNQVSQIGDLVNPVNFYRTLVIGTMHSTIITLALVIVRKL